MDFREVTALMIGAGVEFQNVVFSAGSADLVVARDSSAPHIIALREVQLLKWKGALHADRTSSSVETVGLEKLAAGEVWRLYVQTTAGAELELSCGKILCDDVEVTGIGRSYRH